ncbi:Exosome complex component CSL4 [Halotydeus destructor]|nr:Exosome complex component CSL4 [Halotydeus destructor]
MEVDSDRLYVVPGDCICRADDSKRMAGDGTYSRHGHIFASLAGTVDIIPVPETRMEKVNVVGKGDRLGSKRVPNIGLVVTCKIVSLSLMQAKCSIHCIEHCVLRSQYKGIIRKEDVRAIDKDRVELFKCFRPGDVVLARVVGFGENNCFLLTTAEEELGVAIAYSEEDKDTPMVPVSWTEMVCPTSGQKEIRKVAKIHTEKSLKQQSS